MSGPSDFSYEHIVFRLLVAVPNPERPRLLLRILVGDSDLASKPADPQLLIEYNASIGEAEVAYSLRMGHQLGPGATPFRELAREIPRRGLALRCSAGGPELHDAGPE